MTVCLSPMVVSYRRFATQVSLELGGNAPFIVFDDADLEGALNALLFSKYRNAGQACIASNRIFVQAGVYDKFAKMVADASRDLRCGTINGVGADVISCTPGATPTVGPLIDDRAISKVMLAFDSVLESYNYLGRLYFRWCRRLRTA